MFALTCPVRGYAWGSTTHIARFLGAAPTDQPQAELWIGAHDGDPSLLPDGTRLSDAIRADPGGALGDRVRARFGARLPFLVKALAAAEPLSLQVHPASQRARIGFAEEEAAGVPLGAPQRKYQDPFHKPELLFALTRFEGMAGFRDADRSAQILRRLELPWADGIAGRLESGPPFQTLRSVVTEMLTMSGPDLADLLKQVGAAAARAEQRAHREDLRSGRPERERFSVAREGLRVFAQTARLVDHYPEDPGVLVTLLLNHLVLAPGEAMYVDAGVVHAYASGFGIEVMASSDNVVRAGLTAKHVDVPELLRITNFTPVPPPLWEPVTRGDVLHFDPPATEFTMCVGRPPLTDLRPDGPRIVVVLDGQVEIGTAGGERASLDRGDAVFVEHRDGELSVTGDGRVAVVAVPR